MFPSETANHFLSKSAAENLLPEEINRNKGMVIIYDWGTNGKLERIYPA